MSSTSSPEASSLAGSRKGPRASFAPSVPSLPSANSLDRPSPKWFQRGPGLGSKNQRKFSQRSVASTMNARQRKLWKLQLLAVKKQQAFQEAVQSIPVSEMEKMIGASHAELERATQNYEKFLLANEGKGRYLWSKLRDLVANMDAEAKLRIKLLPVIPMERNLAASASAGPGPTGGSSSQSSSKATSPRALSSSKSGTPRQASKAGTPRAGGSRAGTTPRQVGGSKLGSPQSLLRAAASNAAGQPNRVEITKRPQQTVFKWRTSIHVKLATDLPEELLRYRHDHDFDKYKHSSVFAKAAPPEPAPARKRSDAMGGALDMQQEKQQLSQQAVPKREQQLGPLIEPPQHDILSRCKPTGTRRAAARAKASDARPSRARATGSPREGLSPRPGLPSPKHYGQQWFAPPKLWAVCSAARLQDDDSVIQRLEGRNFPIDLDRAVVEAAAAAAGGDVPVLTTKANSRTPRRSLNARQQELQEKITGNEGVQTYARHLECAGKRLPEYLQKAIRPEQHDGQK